MSDAFFQGGGFPVLEQVTDARPNNTMPTRMRRRVLVGRDMASGRIAG